MRNLSHSHPQVKNSQSTIDSTRACEKVTPYSLRRLILFMTTEPWNTADPASNMFERRYHLLDGLTGSQCREIHGIRRIELDGTYRVEFMLCGSRITSYPDNEAWEALSEMSGLTRAEEQTEAEGTNGYRDASWYP